VRGVAAGARGHRSGGGIRWAFGDVHRGGVPMLSAPLLSARGRSDQRRVSRVWGGRGGLRRRVAVSEACLARTWGIAGGETKG